MTIDFYLLDTFSTRRFRGNPTPVCLVSDYPDDEILHSIARELSQPVTAFVRPEKSTGKFLIRYFTETGEIPACGHATLAAAKVAAEMNGSETVQFKTHQGVDIKCVFRNGKVTMSYPVLSYEPVSVDDEILQSLHVERISASFICHDLETLFIDPDDPRLLRRLAPDFERLKKSSNRVKEVVVTTASDDVSYDFLLRSFCPWIGIDEDPVTGSVHSVLAHYWGQKLGKVELKAFQASERGGELFIGAYDDHVGIGGSAVLIGKGVLYL